MAWFRAEVEVTFIDDATGKPLAVTRVKPEELPESFELETTVHMDEDDWSVVHASPKTRTEYKKTGHLTLRVRRLFHVDPRKILYTLPSICDALGPIGDLQLDGGEYVLHEDDWRQLELISNILADEVDDELARIRQIHEESSAEIGFRKIHVRTKPQQPIRANLKLQSLTEALGPSSRLRGVTYRDAPARITDGYALTILHGLTVYGVAPKGIVHVLAIGQDATATPDADLTERLATLAESFELDLVNWCRCARIPPDHPLFKELLRGEIP